MATGTFTLVETYTTICCPTETCGVNFAINDGYRRRREQDHKWFYCPNGHQMSYGGKTDAEKARDRAREDAELQRQRAETLARQVEIVGNRLTSERRSHAATKGQLTKTKKRADHAMCPVEGCKRSFVNVARHIANQHPGYRAQS